MSIEPRLFAWRCTSPASPGTNRDRRSTLTRESASAARSAIAPVWSVEWSLTTTTSRSTSSCFSTDCNVWAISDCSLCAGIITATRTFRSGPAVGGDRQAVRLNAAKNWTATTKEMRAEKMQRISRESIKKRPNAPFEPRSRHPRCFRCIMA